MPIADKLQNVGELIVRMADELRNAPAPSADTARIAALEDQVETLQNTNWGLHMQIAALHGQVEFAERRIQGM